MKIEERGADAPRSDVDGEHQVLRAGGGHLARARRFLLEVGVAVEHAAHARPADAARGQARWRRAG